MITCVMEHKRRDKRYGGGGLLSRWNGRGEGKGAWESTRDLYPSPTVYNTGQENQAEINTQALNSLTNNGNTSIFAL